MEAFAGEVMRFLVARSADPQLASDAFAAFSEDLLRGLPRFEFRSSVRTWVYTLAHHALARTRQALARERSRSVTLSEATALSDMIARERTQTPPYLRTEVKRQLRALRGRLREDDQLLLDLRTTRRFSWKDIARICLGPDSGIAEAEITKEAARLRKRFQLVTQKLREMAESEGIFPPASED